METFTRIRGDHWLCLVTKYGVNNSRKYLIYLCKYLHISHSINILLKLYDYYNKMIIKYFRILLPDALKK